MTTLSHEEEVAQLERMITRLQQQAGDDAVELEQAYAQRDKAVEDNRLLKAEVKRLTLALEPQQEQPNA